MDRERGNILPEDAEKVLQSIQHLGRKVYGVLGTRGNRWVEEAIIDEVRITTSGIVLMADGQDVELGRNWFTGYRAEERAKAFATKQNVLAAELESIQK